MSGEVNVHRVVQLTDRGKILPREYTFKRRPVIASSWEARSNPGARLTVPNCQWQSGKLVTGENTGRTRAQT
jgi:hypothetical protein